MYPFGRESAVTTARLLLAWFVIQNAAATNNQPVFVKPTGGSTTASVPENSGSGTSIYDISVTDADGDSTFYWIHSIQPYKDFFDMDGVQLQVKSSAKLNAEDVATYTIRFSTADGNGQEVKSDKIVVTVTDVADETAVIPPLTLHMVSGLANGITIGTVDVSAAFTSGVSYVMTPTSTFFVVNSASGDITTTSTAFNDASVTLNVIATSGGNSATVTVTVQSQSNVYFPVTTDSVTATSITADSLIYTPIMAIGSTANSIAGGNTNGDLSFTAGKVKVVNTLDKSATPAYTLTLQADSTGGSDTMTLTVTVDEAPTFDQLAGVNVPENSPADTTVASLSVSQTETDVLTYKIKHVNPDDLLFQLTDDNAHITLYDSSLNREVSAMYTLYLTVEDATTVVLRELVVTVDDVVDESAALYEQYPRLVEKQAQGHVVHTALMEPAFPVAGTTFTIVPASSFFAIDNEGVITTTSSQITYATSTIVILKVVGSYSELSNVATSTVSIDIDTAPTFASPTFTRNVPETTSVSPNPPVVITAQANDADGDGLTITSSITPDQDLSYNIGTGQLTVISALNFDSASVYTVSLTAVDQDSLTATTVITVNVKTEPVFVNPNPSIVEVISKDEGTVGVLYDVSAKDKDGDGFTVSVKLTDPSTDMFGIDSNGDLILSSGSLDYETETTYLIDLEVTDDSSNPGPQSSTVQLRLTLNNVNDIDPVFDPSTYTVSIKEGMGAQADLLQVTSTDADNIVTTFTYTVSGNALFGFTGDMLKTTGSLTYNANAPTITLTIEVVDAPSGGNTGEGTITVTVTEATTPVFSRPTEGAESFDVNEDESIGYTIVTVAASDADNDMLTYAMTGIPAGMSFDPSTRELTIVSPGLDYESLDGHSFTLGVTVTDENGTPAVVSGSVTVSVQDVNEFDPVFSSPVYTHTLEKGATVPDFLTVAATDDDGSGNTIAYTFGSGIPSAFTIGESSGALSVTAVAYASETPTYTLSLIATDSAPTTRTGSAEAHITVVTVPVMTYPVADSEVEIVEGTTGNLLTATSTDEDGDDGTYSLPVSSTVFEMSGAHLVLKTGQTLDYETTTSYTLTIQVTDDDSKSDDTLFTLLVTDANDNAPVFDDITYTDPLVVEQTNSAETVATLSISDVDSSTDNNNVVSLEVTGGDPDTLFSVTGSAGLFMLQGTNLVYNDAPYSLTLTASDRNGAAGFQSTTSVLTINVRKVPEFLTPPAGSAGATISVDEGTANTVTIYTLTSSASSTVTYSIHSQDPDLFELADSVNLKLKSGSILDYEDDTAHVIVFHAEDESSLTGSATLTVSVTDINDNPPVIGPLNNPYNVLERQQTEENVVTVVATDADSSTDIRFSITDGNSDNWFSIGETSGVLTAVSNLQYSAELIQLTVLAEDRSSSTGPTTASTTVSVSILKIPEFTAPPPAGVTITKSEDMTVTDVVYDVAASSSTAVTLGINTQSPTGVFELTGEGGDKLTLVSGQSFDYEGSDDVYTIEFYAVDTVPRTASTTLTVSISDVNDNDPVFESFDSTVTAQEGSSEAVEILALTATDADSSDQDNNVIQYSLTTGDSSLFAVDASSGSVTAVNLAYVAESSSYSLVVTAKDKNGASGARTATAAFTVNVKTTPVFSIPSSAQTISKAEDITNAVIILKLGASDEDGDDITYGFELPSLLNTFEITGASNDEFKLKTGESLNFEGSKWPYTIRFTATDPDGNLGISEPLTLSLTDVNDNDPTFSSATLEVVVKTTATLGATITTVSATDADSSLDGNNVITYSVHGGNSAGKFSLDENTGAITLAQTVALTTPEYQLIIYGTDGGSTPRTGSTTVSITVVEPSDPVITTPPSGGVSINLPETQSVGGVAYTISATDSDKDGLVYQIIAQSPSTKFELSENQVRLKTALDFEQETSYTLTFEVDDIDGNTANKQTSGALVINILNVNESPVFGSTLYEVNVMERQMSEITVIDMDASDEDDGDAGTLTYKIVYGDRDGDFSIDSATGVVKTMTKGLIRRDYHYYYIAVQAEDGGSPKRANSAWVKVTVTTFSGGTNVKVSLLTLSLLSVLYVVL